MTEQQRLTIAAAGTRDDIIFQPDDGLDGKAIEILNNLIALNRDAHSGYSLAAEHASGDRLGRLLQNLADERQEAVRELTLLVANSGGDPAESGRLAGLFHRAWINIKAAVTADDQTIIAECVTGEETLNNAYEDTLSRPDFLTPEALDLLRTQAGEVASAIEQLNSLASQ